MQCPSNSFRYNATQCACNPSYLFNITSRSCYLFNEWGQVEMDSGVDYHSVSFPGSGTIFDFDSIRKLNQSQAVFLEATLFMLLSWLFFCFFARCAPLGDGRSIWFRIRWWISRLDVCFASRHWLDDQQVVMKRKTELGGTFSMASWILFIGLFATLLYQIISKRAIEMHNVRATNAPDLAAFINDLEFNITTISSMSCLHLRGLGTVVTGNPGFVDYRFSPLSTFANYSCINTTKGPTIVLKCSNCPLSRDSAYISWQFVDLPNSPATAIGFQFNLTAKDPKNKKHLSLVSGTLRNGSNFDNKPVTFRGLTPNILKFNFFPRMYHNLHDLRLIQPLLHEFLPGSSFNEISQLQASVQRPNDGLINTTLYVNFLSSYIVEIKNQNVLGPVSFLADLGGLYCISIGLFFYILVQCEYRIKKLRNEDSVMRKVRSRRKAQDCWDKLRKYVMYTYAPNQLEEVYGMRNDGCCTGVKMESLNRKSSSVRGRGSSRLDTISFSRKVSLPSEKRAISEQIDTQGATRFSPESAADRRKSTRLKEERAPAFSAADNLTVPPPPPLESHAADHISMTNLQKDLQNLYEYNMLLREKLIAAQSMLHALTSKESTLAANNGDIITRE
ncbi:PREDICTED: uncharacterized protein LOC109237633 isoform X2 [Nicotiana attenuata]|uniref:uncharacterized protein LOC109237633 isoform X2 n=1 Tax=Nicotiana attenuata TaxID=49451 RepID=UPI0009051384|nr:PREDICTED: uncharacterized protein LOC109237633 isoform X2 [Nicotiana attenuata]